MDDDAPPVAGTKEAAPESGTGRVLPDDIMPPRAASQKYDDYSGLPYPASYVEPAAGGTAMMPVFSMWGSGHCITPVLSYQPYSDDDSESSTSGRPRK